LSVRSGRHDTADRRCKTEGIFRGSNASGHDLANTC